MEKAEAYLAAKAELLRRTENESDLIANLSNASAILNLYMERINWVGFYLCRQNQLVLGPFQGRPACVRLTPGKGVCGTALAEDKTLIVPDVHLFPGHVACDDRSRSEIVIPIHHGKRAVAVLDIDSPEVNRFTTEDGKYLEEMVRLLEISCSWS